MAETNKNSPAPSKSSSKKAEKQRRRDRRTHIAAIVLMVCGLLATLSILSYSRSDGPAVDRSSFADIVKFPFDSAVQARAKGIQNKLGLVGAIVSNFFINSTVGYASIVFPLMMLMWGWVILRKKDIVKPVTLTNYAIILCVLVSTAFAIGNLLLGPIAREWSGVMGGFSADVLTKLLGVAGSSIVVLTALFFTAVFAVDLDIHKSIERFAALYAAIRNRFSREGGEEPSADDEPISEVMIRKMEEETRQDHQDSRAAGIAPEIDDLDLDIHEIASPAQAAADEEDILPVAKPVAIEAREPAAPKPAESEQEEIDYVFPSIELLDQPRQATDTVQDDELKANAELVRSKLAHFGVEIESVSVAPGPVITLYELVPASGVKISRIVSLADDLALALAAKGIRIMAPIPGKSAVGVEIPNRNPSMVYLRSVLNSTKFREMKGNLPIALGKTISGEVYTDDLSRMPHLLIAGSTGSGKSVGINTILASILYRMHPSEVKFIIIDPKKIELTQYAKLKHHFLAVSPDIDEDIITSPENAVGVLRSVELEMEKRYDRLAAAGVRNIQDYNERFKAGRLKDTETIFHRKMPYLIVVIDELADLMMTAAREVEEPIARLAQLARAVGVHLVLATQRPSVDVITGVIKANFPARIAYQVASKTDSRTILDMNGAEQLLGSGDMLYLPSGSPKPFRLQNAYISTDEVERLTDHIARQQGYSKPFPLPSIQERKKAGMRGSSGERDEFFEEAAQIIVRHQQGSVSLLQRRLKVGYSRAARLVDELEAAGIVGPFDGSKAREVLVDDDRQLDVILRNLDN